MFTQPDNSQVSSDIGFIGNRRNHCYRRRLEQHDRDLRYQIREAGYIPKQRDILYNYVNREGVDYLDQKKSMPLKQLSVAFAD